MYKFVFLLLGLINLSILSFAQGEDLKTEIRKLQSNDQNLNHRLDQLEKMVDDVLWYNKVGDIAHVDKLYIYGPPKWKEENPTAKGAGNPVKFWTYTFIPKILMSTKNTR